MFLQRFVLINDSNINPYRTFLNIASSASVLNAEDEKSLNKPNSLQGDHHASGCTSGRRNIYQGTFEAGMGGNSHASFKFLKRRFVKKIPAINPGTGYDSKIQDHGLASLLLFFEGPKLGQLKPVHETGKKIVCTFPGIALSSSKSLAVTTPELRHLT